MLKISIADSFPRHLAGEEDYGKRRGPTKSCCRGDFFENFQTTLEINSMALARTHQAKPLLNQVDSLFFPPALCSFSVAAAAKRNGIFHRGVDMHELFVTYLNLKKISTLRLIRSECERRWRVGF